MEGLFSDDDEAPTPSVNFAPRGRRASSSAAEFSLGCGASSGHTVLPHSEAVGPLPLAAIRPAEVEEGNVEYKLDLRGAELDSNRVTQLSTQCIWRMREGSGKAFYILGTLDNGNPVGITEDALASSLAVLRRIADAASAAIVHVTLFQGRSGVSSRVAEVELEARPVPIACRSEVRVALLGGGGSGKSTLVGVLTNGQLDDGHGSARLHVTRHRHEVEHGSTSTWSQHVIGFTQAGALMNHGSGLHLTNQGAAGGGVDGHHPDVVTRGLSPGDILQRSASIVTLVDTGPFPKFTRTLLAGLLGSKPHYTLLTLDARDALAMIDAGSLKDGSGGPTTLAAQLLLAKALGITPIAVITKADLIPAVGLTRVSTGLAALAAPLHPVATVVCTSCVSGLGISDLVAALHSLVRPESPQSTAAAAASSGHTAAAGTACPGGRFDIQEVFSVDGRTILGGRCARRPFSVGDKVRLGPLADGGWADVTVCSVHRHRVPMPSLHPDESGTLHVEVVGGADDVDVSRGMVLLHAGGQEGATKSFTVRIPRESDASAWLHAGRRAVMIVSFGRREVDVMSVVAAADGTDLLVAMTSKRWCFLEAGDAVVISQDSHVAVGSVT